MNILYYGFVGAPRSVLIGYILLGACLFFTVVSIIEIAEKEWIGGGVFGVLALGLIFSVCNAFIDNRTPIVKATLDSNISYVEVNKDYELMKQEGKIYQFKVLNTTNEEWEAVVEEKQNEL